MKSMGVQSSDELQWLDIKIGHKGSCSNNGHQSDMPYWMLGLCVLGYWRWNIPVERWLQNKNYLWI